MANIDKRFTMKTTAKKLIMETIIVNGVDKVYEFNKIFEIYQIVRVDKVDRDDINIGIVWIEMSIIAVSWVARIESEI